MPLINAILTQRYWASSKITEFRNLINTSYGACRLVRGMVWIDKATHYEPSLAAELKGGKHLTKLFNIKKCIKFRHIIWHDGVLVTESQGIIGEKVSIYQVPCMALRWPEAQPSIRRCRYTEYVPHPVNFQSNTFAIKMKWVALREWFHPPARAASAE